LHVTRKKLEAEEKNGASAGLGSANPVGTEKNGTRLSTKFYVELLAVVFGRRAVFFLPQPPCSHKPKTVREKAP
jgi:hypothetical protein